MTFYCFLVSVRDATVALAERIAGTEDKFVEMMNAKVKELGLKNTNFLLFNPQNAVLYEYEVD